MLCQNLCKSFRRILKALFWTQVWVGKAPKKNEAWINGKPLKRGNTYTAKLPTGKHRIVVRLDAKALPKAFRLESDEAAFLNE